MARQDRPQRLVRPAPTRFPMAYPGPALVAITDTNALATRACNTARRGAIEDLFIGLASTGRSNTYVSAHVPGELDDHLADVAANHEGLALADAQRLLWGQIMPRVPVVDLAIRDYLHPRVRPLMRDDPELPRRLRGDVDDIGTAALAEFLAPAVIISADNVFTRFGLANTLAETWLPTAYTLLNAAGFEANLTDAAIVLEIVARMLLAASGSAIRTARRYLLPTLAALLGTGYLAWRGGYLSRDRLRVQTRQLSQSEALRSLIDKLAESAEGHQRAHAALLVVEPYGPPAVEQLAARHLARCGRRLGLADLNDAMALNGYSLEPGELEDAIRHHPAFTVDAEGAYGIGRPARTRAAGLQAQVR